MMVRLEDVTKRFGKLKALDDVTLEMTPGEVVVVLGLNGAGKTTLLHVLCGILSVQHGKVWYGDDVFSRERLDLRRKVAILPEAPPVFPEHTVAQHAGMVVQLYARDEPASVERMLALMESFDILEWADTPFSSLSRGIAYKAALSALLAVEPELLLLDEPFAAGMDSPGLDALRVHLRRATERGATVVYTTQIVEVAETFSDRACVLVKGALRSFAPLEPGSTRDLLA